MDTPATIIVVDDDPRFRELLRDYLEIEAYRVFEAADSEALFALLRTQNVDLVTLDISLGTENGLSLIGEIRRLSDVGVIMVTGRDELIDKVVGLELGADDYVAKPIELRELTARVRSVLRRYDRGPRDDVRGPAWSFGPWRLYPEARTLEHTDGTACELSGSEFDLLSLLVDNAHKVLSRDAIMEALRGRDWHPSDRTIDNFVVQLRKKIEGPGQPRRIRTVRGVGYQFVGEVRRG